MYHTIRMTRRGSEGDGPAIQGDSGLQSLGGPVGQAWNPSLDHAALAAGVSARIQASGKQVSYTTHDPAYYWAYEDGVWKYVCRQESNYTIDDGQSSPIGGTLTTTLEPS